MTEAIRKKEEKVLHFLSQNVHVCIELNYVSKVILLPALEIIPNAPSYMVGLLNLSGISIAIIDLAIAFGLTRTQPYSLDTPILICTDNNNQIGLLVDQIIGLTQITESSLQMQDKLRNKNSPFQAVATVNSTLSLLINMPYIFQMNSIASNIPIVKNEIIDMVHNERE